MATQNITVLIGNINVILDWDPTLPRFLKVTPAVYPHLNDFTGKLNFRY